MTYEAKPRDFKDPFYRLGYVEKAYYDLDKDIEQSCSKKKMLSKVQLNAY